MAGMQFEYDEKGGTFYYFLLSFMALVLIPLTYYVWPRKENKEETEEDQRQCRCNECFVKRYRLKANEPWTNVKNTIIKVAIVIGWCLFAACAYKASQVEIDYTEFDPFMELGIDRGASTAEIKRAYRKLTLTHHPDKGGDPVRFLRITKAHQALTDETARKNWEEYGNPDGPGATHFGIALPKWIVEKDNSIWVLAAYGLVFMVILPIVVGTWWYRSIKYSTEQILMDTMNLYGTFFQRTPNMMLKRVIMILAGSFEFEKGHNHEIQERPSDNEEIPMLMRDLPALEKKNKQRPFCFPYSVKARALLHAHFSRINLPMNTLEMDKLYILKKCPYLINEMVNIVAQLVAYARAEKVQRSVHSDRFMMPRLETIENCMKLSPMIMQALWENKSPLLQLPHITEDKLRHFTTRRRNIRNLRQLANMKDDDRRSLLRTLSDGDYANVYNVLSALPLITMHVRSEVLDDEDTTIAAGDIVTVFVKLHRDEMGSLFSKEDIFIKEEPVEEKVEEDVIEEDAEEKELTEVPQVNKPKVWEINKNKKKGKGAKPKKKNPKQINNVKRVVNGPAVEAVGTKEKEEAIIPNGNAVKVKKNKEESNEEDDDDDVPSIINSDSEAAIDSEIDEDSEIINNDDQNDDHNDDDDEEDWLKFQEEFKKDNILDTKSKETHEVHCPCFPSIKYEWWWLYVADKKNHTLITAPLLVTSLKREEEFQLKFCAPIKPGIYQYTVIMRSDSYLDMDLFHNIKLDVKEAKKVESHPQWDISDDEAEKDDEEGSESDESSGYAYSDED